MANNQDPDPVSGLNILDHISESLQTIFCVKNPDPGYGIRIFFDPGSGIRQPGWKKIRIWDLG